MRVWMMRFVLFQCARARFACQTWMNKRAIARAYRTPFQLHLSPRLIRGALAAIGVVFLLAMLIAVAPGIISTARRAVAAMHADERRVHPRKKTAVDRQKAATASSEKIPAPLRAQDIFADGDMALIAVKSDRTLSAFRFEKNSWRQVAQYRVAIGRNGGRKISAGDKRTPEGLYFIVGRRDRSEMAPGYGPFAYILDYPNDEDRASGRTGEGIWIHGSAGDSGPAPTRGCIELHNGNLYQLCALLKIGIGIPVAIVDTGRAVSPDSMFLNAYVKERRERIMRHHSGLEAHFTRVLSEWQRAWQSRDIASYASFYDTTAFYGQGMGWPAWRDTKIRTFANYDTIAVHIDSLVVTDYTDSLAIVKFLQRYASNVTRSEGAKKIVLVNKTGAWKIFRESTISRQEYLL
jgi:hypothetical protein